MISQMLLPLRTSQHWLLNWQQVGPHLDLSYHADAFENRRLHASKVPARKMAWAECHAMGLGHCIHCSRKELSRSPYLPRFPWHIRGCYVTLFNAHNR